MLPQEGHVDERHAPRVEGKEKHVPRKVLRGPVREVQFLDAPEAVEREGALGGPVYAGIDTAEGVALRGEPLLYGAVVDGAQDAVVERHGVLRHAAGAQVGFVFAHQGGVQFVRRKVGPAPEAAEAGQCGGVVFGRPLPAPLLQPAYDVFHEAEEGHALFQHAKPLYDLVGGEFLPPCGQFADDAAEPSGVAVDGLPDGAYAAGAFFFRSAGGGGLHFVPFGGEEPVAGCDLPDAAAVGDEIDDGARAAFDRGGAEFCFYCCHAYIIFKIGIGRIFRLCGP